MSIELPLHIRQQKRRARWTGAPGDTWQQVQSATALLLERWRPERLLLWRAVFDEWNQPETPTSIDLIPTAELVLNTLVDVVEILVADPLEMRLMIPTDEAMPGEIWFIDPDQHRRVGRLRQARAFGGAASAWLDPGVGLQRGFVVYVHELGVVDVEWDVGPFAGANEDSSWKRADAGLDAVIESGLRELNFEIA